MPKFYVKSNSLELIVSCPDPLEAAVKGFLATNKNDIIDEYFYIDEKGMRDYTNADSNTTVIRTADVVSAAHELYDD